MWPNPEFAPAHPKLMVAKIYRPGRWSFDQIKDEHNFLLQLFNADLGVVAPLVNLNQTLWKMA